MRPPREGGSSSDRRHGDQPILGAADPVSEPGGRPRRASGACVVVAHSGRDESRRDRCASLPHHRVRDWLGYARQCRWCGTGCEEFAQRGSRGAEDRLYEGERGGYQAPRGRVGSRVRRRLRRPLQVPSEVLLTVSGQPCHCRRTSTTHSLCEGDEGRRKKGRDSRTWMRSRVSRRHPVTGRARRPDDCREDQHSDADCNQSRPSLEPHGRKLAVMTGTHRAAPQDRGLSTRLARCLKCRGPDTCWRGPLSSPLGRRHVVGLRRWSPRSRWSRLHVGSVGPSAQ
ncbi:hypothetical protein CLV52_0914 [Amnibacterium kyonggiense]|uniref:Uncharacterized protein n=1 Tax=Amnibacterium kyonggiense TaxID=595671 RepID=A0A4R7FRI1_9MICO|nr:hypothetical protein CLV52_0914 [Amnibacterium kyonggiense]